MLGEDIQVTGVTEDDAEDRVRWRRRRRKKKKKKEEGQGEKRIGTSK